MFISESTLKFSLFIMFLSCFTENNLSCFHENNLRKFFSYWNILHMVGMMSLLNGYPGVVFMYSFDR